MIDKTKIRVVKRTETAAARSEKRKVAKSGASAREMVSNVTAWVSDLKQRKSEETKAAFELLKAANRRANES
jgi:flagellar hook-basal body complex protein FliE